MITKRPILFDREEIYVLNVRTVMKGQSCQQTIASAELYGYRVFGVTVSHLSVDRVNTVSLTVKLCVLSSCLLDEARWRLCVWPAVCLCKQCFYLC